MELKPNMYIRTEDGLIRKLKKHWINGLWMIDKSYVSDEPEYHDNIVEDEILKASYDIIDLIEKDDLIKIEYYSQRYEKRVTRLFEVDFINKKNVRFLNGRCELNIFDGKWSNEDIKLKPIIKQILTHEQFESISYKVD